MRRSPPFSYVLRAFPEPIGMIAGRVGDGVDRFDAGFLPRQWQYCLHGCNRRLMSFMIGGASPHLTVGQACTRQAGRRSSAGIGGPSTDMYAVHAPQKAEKCSVAPLVVALPSEEASSWCGPKFYLRSRRQGLGKVLRRLRDLSPAPSGRKCPARSGPGLLTGV